MARVNVDETVYASIPLIQSYTGLSYPTIIGHLVLLWRFSQENGRISGNIEEICDWAYVAKDQEIFVKGLLKAQFLKKLPCLNADASSMLVASVSIPDDHFIIVGNEKHIVGVNNYKARARKAAAKRWAKVLDIPGKGGNEGGKHLTQGVNNAPSHAPSIENHAPSIKTDAPSTVLHAQTNTNQTKPNKKNTNTGIRTEYPDGFDSIWKLYDRKGDKKKSFEIWKGLKLTQGEGETLMRAIKTYQMGRPEIKYRKDLERFLAMDWRELGSTENTSNGLNGHGSGISPETARRIASFERLNAQFQAEASGNGVPHA